MERQNILAELHAAMPELRARFGVERLGVFGSVARATAEETSDVDILVAFDGPANSQRYFGLLFFLEDLLEQPVDLVTEKALRPEIKPYIAADLIYV
jgi:predicted nucleotidyltransferase